MIFGSTDVYDGLFGDDTDNESPDLALLTWVVPGEDADSVTWVEIEMEERYTDYVDNIEASENPDIVTATFMQTDPDNELDRDEDELPDNVDDEGDDYM